MYATQRNEQAAESSAAKPAGEAQPRRSRAAIEAARHTVLRRLGPALKHDMVVNLQAVSMMAETLNARLERSNGATADLQANMAKLNRLARDAVATCLRVHSWIDPGEDDTVALHTGVQECASLMGNGLNFRGFRLVNEVGPTEFEVCRGALRTLLAGSILSLADGANGAAGELLVRADVAGSHAVLSVTFNADGEGMPFDANAPRIDWGDLQALAAAEQVELFRTAQQVTMRLPRAVPSTPLRMAPI